MDIDTSTIRRLRDALVEGGVLQTSNAGGLQRPASNRSRAAWQRVSPFIETMYLVMLADGHVDASERLAITSAARLLTGDALAESDIGELLDGCESIVREHGVEQRLQAIGARLSADRLDRETAFTLAAAVALADGAVHAAELDLVDSVAEWFGISSKRARELMGSA